MAQKLIYWGSTGIVAALAAFAGINYLMGTQQVVEGFAHTGYPPHLRVLLGIAKVAGAIVLVAPGFPKLKEWAYAGFTFAWIAAAVAHYVAGDGGVVFVPVILLVLLGVSYATRPASRRWLAGPVGA